MGKPKKDRQFWESAYMNNATYMHYYNRLMELAISRFQWDGLPPTVDQRYLELTLFSKGQAVFFKEDGLDDYVALNVNANGKLDMYGIPTKRRAYGVGYQYDKELDETNSVIIFNNYLHLPCMRDIEIFARELYDIDQAIRVNAKAQKTPILIACDENQRMTMVNLYKQYEGNEPFIFGTKAITPDSLKAISTGAPYVADKLYELKTLVWNEALTYLGISNVNVVKKERLISDEVIRNQGGIISSRFSPLEMRRKACDEINELFELNVSVQFMQDYREADDELMLEGDTGDNDVVSMVTDMRTRTKMRPKMKGEL